MKSRIIVTMILISIFFPAGILNAQTASDFYSEGVAWEKQQEYDKALISYQNALEVIESNTVEKKMILANASSVALRLNEYALAYDYASEALSYVVTDKKGNIPEQFKQYDRDCLNTVGFIQAQTGMYKYAIENIKKSIDLSIELEGEDSLTLQEGYITLAGCYANIGATQLSLFYSKKALGLFLKSHEQTKKQLEELSNTHTDSSKQKTADELRNKLNRLLVLDAYWICYYNLDISVTYTSNGDYETAREYTDEALKYASELGEYSLEKIHIYDQYAMLSIYEEDYDEAQDYLDSEMKQLRELYGENSSEFAQIYYSRAFLDVFRNEFDSAEKNIEKFDELIAQQPVKTLTEQILSSSIRGIIAERQEDFAKCLEYRAQTLSYGETLVSQGTPMIQLALSFFTDAVMEKIPESLSAKKDELQQRALALGINSIQAQQQLLPEYSAEILAQTVPIYYAGVDNSIKTNNLEKAFYFSEMLRAQGFLQEIGTEAALSLQGILPEEKTSLETLMMKIKILEAELKFEPTDTRLRQIESAKNELSALETKITERIPAYEQLRNPPIVKLSDAQKWCASNQVILEYVMYSEDYTYGAKQTLSGGDLSFNPFDDEELTIPSYCLVITRNGVTAVPLDSDYNYSKKIDLLRERITKGQTLDSRGLRGQKGLYDLRTELYAKLIEPVLQYIPKSASSLLIVPDGSLSSLPFDILGDGTNKNLGDVYAITLSPSISVSMQKETAQNRTTNFLGLGDAVYNVPNVIRPGRSTTEDEELESQALFSYENAGEYYTKKGFRWSNIHGTGVEVSTVQQSVFKRDKTKTYFGEAVTESLIKQLSQSGELASYSQILLSCHGYFNEEIPAFSTLVFSEVSGSIEDSKEDGYLTVAELAALNMNADFLNLSACQTGLSSLKRGDGMSGLFRSCIIAGAEHVGATLWEVSDEATCVFQTILYKYIRKGTDYSVAYKKAKEELRKQYPEPRYWAPFVLYE